MFVTLLIFALGLLGLMAVAFGLLSGPSAAKTQAKRLAGLKDRHNPDAGFNAERQMRKILAKRDSHLDSMAGRFMPRPELLRIRLSQTGKNWTMGKYMLISGGLFAITFLLILVQGLPPLLGLFVALFVAAFIPHYVVGFLIKRRINKFNAKFPDAIELLVRGLRSGLPISETLTLVAQEIPDPVGTEFRQVVEKIRIGKTMDEALQETAKRLGTPEFKFFGITLNIQRETGGNLAETLSNLATVLRGRSQMKLKIKAMSSESKASAYIVGSLPFIVFGLIMSINPNYMSQFFVDERLIIAGIGGMVWMGIGVFIMAKMVNFEI